MKDEIEITGVRSKIFKCVKCGKVATVRAYKKEMRAHFCTECAMEIEKMDRDVHLVWLSS